VADVGWSVNHVRLLISLCLQNLCFFKFRFGHGSHSPAAPYPWVPQWATTAYFESFPIRHVQFSFIPNTVNIFFSLKHPEIWSPRNLLFSGNPGEFPWGKATAAWSWPFVLSSAVFKNERGCNFTFHTWLRIVHRNKLTVWPHTSVWNIVRKPLVGIFWVLFEISNVDGISI
jgi:hypothetical protein